MMTDDVGRWPLAGSCGEDKNDARRDRRKKEYAEEINVAGVAEPYERYARLPPFASF